MTSHWTNDENIPADECNHGNAPPLAEFSEWNVCQREGLECPLNNRNNNSKKKYERIERNAKKYKKWE